MYHRSKHSSFVNVQFSSNGSSCTSQSSASTVFSSCRQLKSPSDAPQPGPWCRPSTQSPVDDFSSWGPGNAASTNVEAYRRYMRRKWHNCKQHNTTSGIKMSPNMSLYVRNACIQWFCFRSLQAAPSSLSGWINFRRKSSQVWWNWVPDSLAL